MRSVGIENLPSEALEAIERLLVVIPGETHEALYVTSRAWFREGCLVSSPEKDQDQKKPSAKACGILKRKLWRP